MDKIMPVLGSDTSHSRDVISKPSHRETAEHRYNTHVLIVDDNPVNRILITRVLEKSGCHVTTAENGRLALDVLESESFDLVFMDVEMPELNGFEAVQRIRAEERWRKLPVVAMTAHILKGDRERCLDAGMDDYICKPVKATEVCNMIDKWTKSETSSTRALESREDSQPLTEVIIDIEKALAQVDGDRELVLEALGVFLDTSPALLTDLRTSVATDDAFGLQSAAHSLKGAASAICAERVCQIAKNLETMGQTGKFQNAEPVVVQMETALNGLRAVARTIGDD